LRTVPNLSGIVFHPSRLRIDLLVFLLIDSNNLTGMIEEHTARAGSTLVDGGYVFIHDVILVIVVMFTKLIFEFP